MLSLKKCTDVMKESLDTMSENSDEEETGQYADEVKFVDIVTLNML